MIEISRICHRIIGHDEYERSPITFLRRCRLPYFILDALQQKKQAVIDATVGTTDTQVMEKLTYDDIKSIVGL